MPAISPTLKVRKPGRSTTSTPAKPTNTAVQRRQPTCSLRNITDSTVTKIGIRKIIVNTSAIGSKVKAITDVMLPVAPAAARSHHKRGRRAITTSRQRSPLLMMKGSAARPNTAPRNTDS
jgi:hypothetical protein